MNRNFEQLKKLFNEPHFRELIENNDWKTLIEEGYFNNILQLNDLASFIIYELNYPLLEQFDGIPECCFWCDQNIGSDFVIPDTIEYIQSFSFERCLNLTTITIPSSVVDIEDFAFHDCINLTDVYYEGTREEFEESVGIIGNDEILNVNFHQI